MRRVELSAPARTFVVFATISLLLIGTDRIGLLSGVRSIFDSVLVPVERGAYQVSLAIRKPFEILRFWRTGVSRIADLERQVAELNVEVARVKQLEEENWAMRKLLDAPLSPSWSFVPAAVLGKQEHLSIGIGSDKGIEVGEAVIFEKVLLGVVFEVSSKRSRVRLLTNPESKISVYDSQTSADGLLVGEFGSQMIITQVLQKQDLRKDDLLITSGDIGAPRGLVVGKIEEVISDETDIHKRAIVKPFIDVSSLNTVFVVKES